MTTTLQILEDEPTRRLVLGADRSRITCDAKHGVSISAGRWAWWTPAIAIAIDDIERVQIAMQRDFTLELSVHYWRVIGRGRTKDVVTRTFAVRDVDLYAEAIDLAFRIAQIIRFEGYLLRGKDPPAIELVREGPDGVSPFRLHAPIHEISTLAPEERTRAIERVASPASYAANRVQFVEPDPPVPALAKGDAIAGLEVETWDPPRLVELRGAGTESHTISTSVFAAVVLALAWIPLALFVALLWWFVTTLRGPDNPGIYGFMDVFAVILVVVVMLVLLLIGIAAAAGAIAYLRSSVQRMRAELAYRAGRRIRIDGERRIVTIEAGRRRRDVRFEDIEGVVQRSRTWGTPDDWSEIELALAGDDERLYVSPIEPSVGGPEVLRFTVAIARVVGVGWRVDRLLAKPVALTRAGKSPSSASPA